MEKAREEREFRAAQGLQFLPTLFGLPNVQITYHYYKGKREQKSPEVTDPFIPSITRMLDAKYDNWSGFWVGQTNILYGCSMYFRLTYKMDHDPYRLYHDIDIFISSDPGIMSDDHQKYL